MCVYCSLIKANGVSETGCGLTFEEDKLPLTVLIDSVDLGGQPFPEIADLHGVPGHHRVITHPPEPLILMRISYNSLLYRKPSKSHESENPSEVLSTLKTNSSWRRMASVLKPPSQMLGLEFGLEGLDFCGGRWGRLWRSCFRGSDGGCRRGGGAVVSSRVGWGFLSGGPGIIKRMDLPLLVRLPALSDHWPCVSFNKQDMQGCIQKLFTWAFNPVSLRCMLRRHSFTV